MGGIQRELKEMGGLQGGEGLQPLRAVLYVKAARDGGAKGGCRDT